MLSEEPAGPVVEGDKMRLVGAAITKDFAFISPPYRHSLAGTVDKPVEVTIETEGGFNIRNSIAQRSVIDIGRFSSPKRGHCIVCRRFRKGNQVQDSSRIHFLVKDLVEFSK